MLVHCILSVKSYCLFLGGHTLRLTPPRIELYILAIDFHILIGAYPHIILLLGRQLTDTLRSRLILADRHRLGALKLAAGTILHLVAGGLGRLLFPGHLKAFLGSGDFRYAGALGVNVVGHGLTAAVIALEGHFYGVFAHILHTLGIADFVIRTVFQGLALAVFHGHRRFLHLAVIGVSGFAQLNIRCFRYRFCFGCFAAFASIGFYAICSERCLFGYGTAIPCMRMFII